MAIFGQRLAQPERKGHFAIRQVANNLARAPLPRRGRLPGAKLADGFHQESHSPGRRPDDLQRILTAQEEA